MICWSKFATIWIAKYGNAVGRLFLASHHSCPWFAFHMLHIYIADRHYQRSHKYSLGAILVVDDTRLKLHYK